MGEELAIGLGSGFGSVSRQGFGVLETTHRIIVWCCLKRLLIVVVGVKKVAHIRLRGR